MASCMVVGGAQSSDSGPNRNIRSIYGSKEGQGECSCCGNNPRVIAAVFIVMGSNKVR